MEKKIERQILAIMFVDIIGYSKKMGDDEQETLRMLDEYKQIAEPLIESHEGKIIKWLGDGLFCRYTSAINAVTCGLELQAILAEYNKNPKGKFPINVRIGIHLGDVVIQDGDIFGDGVNIAARIESKAPANGICITETVYSAISSHPQFKIVSMGRIELKNIQFVHTLYRVETGFETGKLLHDKYRRIDIFNFDDPKRKVLSIFALVLLAIFSIGLLYTNYWPRDNSDIYDSKKSNIRNEDSSKVIKDKLFINSLLDTDGRLFYNEIRKYNTFDELISYLKQEKQKGNLLFGKKSDFYSTNDKFIIIIKDDELIAILFQKSSKFFNLQNGVEYDSLREAFKGARAIWVELVD